MSEMSHDRVQEELLTHHEHSLNKLNAALLLTAVFAVVELAGGWISGSLALLADAVHMVSDVGALGLAGLAGRIAARPANAGMSYGYGRVRVLAAQVNGFSLWFVAGWIAWEAVGRIHSPPQVHGVLMLGIATVGLIVNIIILKWFHGGHDLNTRAVYWHVLGDMLGSVAAIVAGIVIVWTGWMPIDPVLSLVVVLILVWGGWRLVRDTTLQIMEAAPTSVDMETLRIRIASVNGVNGVHHIHVWTLPDERLALSAHVCIQNMAVWPEILPQLLSTLNEEGVFHATLQPENDEDTCPDDE